MHDTFAGIGSRGSAATRFAPLNATAMGHIRRYAEQCVAAIGWLVGWINMRMYACACMHARAHRPTKQYKYCTGGNTHTHTHTYCE